MGSAIPVRRTGVDRYAQCNSTRAAARLTVTGGMKMFENLTGLEGGLFSDLRRMQQDLEEIFGGRTSPTGIRSVARGSYPPINVGVTSEGVDVYLFAAGLDPKTLDISLQQNLLTIAGDRTVDMPDSAQYYRRERFSGPFRRTISIPSPKSMWPPTRRPA